MLWRLFRYEAVDFSFMLVVVGALAGAIWGLDRAFFAGRRQRAAAAAGTPAERVREPVAVEYARSFFPVILLVLVIRSFLFEPFRIPSDSMMPTLFDGDFIFVSKYSYGLRLPVTQHPAGSDRHAAARRCDRVPAAAESENQLHQAPGRPAGRPDQSRREQPAVRQRRAAAAAARPDLHRTEAEPCGTTRGCPPPTSSSEPSATSIMFAKGGVTTGEWVVPAGHYFFMGDNRNNSKDSRWQDDPDAPGFVPEQNLVGKAVRIWLNLDTRDGPLWKRIGDAIQ